VTFDLLVVGGGIVGAGVARDAAMRGMSVALVEQRDLAFGTSSRSSKLVHGGLRYLEQGEFSLVFESVSERRVLLEIAPHLVQPLGFLFPIFQQSRFGPLAVNLGMWLYDGLSLFRSPKIHRNLSTRDVADEEPVLSREGLRGAQLYFDCATDDARLVLENALDAARLGATLHTWHRVEHFLREAAGHVTGAHVRDTILGVESDIHARVVINATGPWTDATRGKADAPPLLRRTKGVHIVVDRARLPLRHAVVCAHPGDGRVLFAIPWRERAYVGTTDTDWAGDPADVAADAADVTYLLRAANHHFPTARLGAEDVIATWAGLRPLVSADGSASSVSREHVIVVDPDGLITVAGGKLTTYRKMAAELVDRAVAMLRLCGAPPPPSEAHTARVPLPGAVGWPEDDDAGRVAALVLDAHALDRDIADHLVATYGTRAIDVARFVAEDPARAERLVEGRPEILGQVDWAVRDEHARRVEDVMMRRTQLYFRDLDQGLGAAPAVSARMATLLGWSEARRAEELERYHEEVATSRAWRDG
jgi:glycerol-3-phosphate dehydrogenase